MSSKEDIWIGFFTVTNDEIKELGGKGGAMYAAAWASDSKDFLANLKMWLDKDGYEVLDCEEIDLLENHKYQNPNIGDVFYKNIHDEIGSDNKVGDYDVWYGEVHVFTDYDA